ncbi:MAG: demethoxyubiquinone hydroxylase family protein [Alphaproteobacteria bacterium]
MQSDKDEWARMLRVNHAGEYGATRIYAGQMAVLGRLPSLEKMADEESQHLRLFTDLMIQNNVRPTVLQPLWSVLGFGLGVVTAALGERAAHACTIAVEDVIEDHYQRQLNQLLPSTSTLAETLRKTIVHCQLEEIAHKAEAVKLGGEDTPLFPVLSGVIKTSARIAIWLSERI